jgi:hypothetical protein
MLGKCSLFYSGWMPVRSRWMKPSSCWRHTSRALWRDNDPEKHLPQKIWGMERKKKEVSGCTHCSGISCRFLYWNPLSVPNALDTPKRVLTFLKSLLILPSTHHCILPSSNLGSGKISHLSYASVVIKKSTKCEALSSNPSTTKKQK